MDEVIRRRLRCFGAVQGVGFRYRAEHRARLEGATGWVRNEADGSVTLELQGTEKQIDRVLEAIQRGRYIQIDAMDARAVSVRPGERGFSVLDDEW